MFFRRKKAKVILEKNIDNYLNYSFSINEETIIHDEIIKNIYSLNLYVLSIEEDSENRTFNIITKEQSYNLDVELKKQGQLINGLKTITEDIIIRTDFKGSIIFLENYKEILKKWKKLKPKLKEKNKGVLAHGYIDAIGEKIEDESSFLEDLKQYRLFGFMFNGIIQNDLDEKSNFKRDRLLQNIIYSIPINVIEKVKLKNTDANNTLYEISATLKKFDEKTKDRLNKYFKYYEMGNESLYLENYNGQYLINNKTKLVEKAKLEVELSNGRGYKRKLEYELELKK